MKALENNYLNNLSQLLQLNKVSFNNGVKLIGNELYNLLINYEKRVWLIGNGGSASTIEHFETDISEIRKPNLTYGSRVQALTSNSALITATSNDVSYDELFSSLLKLKAFSGDLLISVTASGNSKNIINAVSVAKEMKIRTISILGFDGGLLLGKSDEDILIKSEIGEYELVEDIHLALFHAVKLYLRSKVEI